MENRPTYRELWNRCLVLDDMLCDEAYLGDNSDRAWKFLGYLRTGKLPKDKDEAVYCPECGHINGLGHSCDMWDENHESTGIGFWEPL